jgi:hypothetical protein
LSGLEPTFDLNIGFTNPGVERVASGLLKASPTFRRQCAVVGALENLAVVIGGPRGRMPMQVRARTELRRYAGGSVLAIVELPTLASAAMLAHEFEHVLEYMERHQQATPDVAERGDFRAGRYPSESERALLAERAAAREVADRDPVRRRAEDLLKGLLRSWPAAR